MTKIIKIAILGFILKIVVSGSVLFAQNAQAETGSLIQTANWLLGTWQTVTPKQTLFETWKKLNDNAFTGKSYAIRGSDTLVFEKVELVRRGEDVFYIPTVSNQNSGQPVSFKSKSFSESEMVFVNPAHDFPQQITYTRVPPDSLHAVVSGMVNGKLKTQEFKMWKFKD